MIIIMECGRAFHFEKKLLLIIIIGGVIIKLKCTLLY